MRVAALIWLLFRTPPTSCSIRRLSQLGRWLRTVGRCIGVTDGIALWLLEEYCSLAFSVPHSRRAKVVRQRHIVPTPANTRPICSGYGSTAHPQDPISRARPGTRESGVLLRNTSGRQVSPALVVPDWKDHGKECRIHKPSSDGYNPSLRRHLPGA